MLKPLSRASLEKGGKENILLEINRPAAHVGMSKISSIIMNIELTLFITAIVSECRMFCAVQTPRVIFTAKTSLDVFSLRRDKVWTFSVLGDQIYEISCLFVAVGLMNNALAIVLPHWNNMS